MEEIVSKETSSSGDAAFRGGLAAQPLQLLRRVDLGQRAGGRGLDETEEAHDGDAVAQMRRAAAGELGGALLRAREGDRVGALHDRAAGLFDEPRDRFGRAVLVVEDLSLGRAELREPRAEIARLADVGDRFEAVADGVREFSAVDEKLGAAVGIDDGVGERERRVRDVAAADVEEPGDRGRIGEDGGVGALLAGELGDLRDLLADRLAGERFRLLAHRGERRLRAVLPCGVERILVDRHELAARRFQRLGEMADLPARHQPGVVADALAGRRIGLQPVPGGRLDAGDGLEDGAVDLVAHLQRVAAVDEDRRLVGEHDRGAGRAGEAGEPGEPLGRFRQVFALVLVGMGDDEAVERQLLQLFAQSGGALGALGGIGGFGEGLEHAARL